MSIIGIAAMEIVNSLNLPGALILVMVLGLTPSWFSIKGVAY
jgi:hypothetical protein